MQEVIVEPPITRFGTSAYSEAVLLEVSDGIATQQFMPGLEGAVAVCWWNWEGDVGLVMIAQIAGDKVWCLARNAPGTNPRLTSLPPHTSKNRNN